MATQPETCKTSVADSKFGEVPFVHEKLDQVTLWEAHAPKYGVTSLVPGFRHFDAVHVLKCGCSLQNQRLEQATPTHSLDYT